MFKVLQNSRRNILYISVIVKEVTLKGKPLHRHKLHYKWLKTDQCFNWQIPISVS